jgi:hypothetical protein
MLMALKIVPCILIVVLLTTFASDPPTDIQNYKECRKESTECAGDQIDQEQLNGLSKIQVQGLRSNSLSVSTISKSNLVTVFVNNYGGVFRKEM